MNKVLRVGLLGFGKAGRAVASVLAQQAGLQLSWVFRQSKCTDIQHVPATTVPIYSKTDFSIGELLKNQPVDAIVDFSSVSHVYEYGNFLNKNMIVVLAISNYGQRELEFINNLAQNHRIMHSPNITLGINFLILAARLLRDLAPFADVAIVEQHFKSKPDVSGTARRIAQQLDVDSDDITSLRLGGIVGHHEVIFGFPYQTVKLVHESISREAFGTGAVFAITHLNNYPNGLYQFDDILMKEVRRIIANQ
jgi:4-hydroxy-tetrahydrodipicolinate reductase